MTHFIQQKLNVVLEPKTERKYDFTKCNVQKRVDKRHMAFKLRKAGYKR